jgi:predicted LPLAT superfamily acyltransferase
MNEAPRFRNPGPTWGYAFLTRAQRVVPRWLLRVPLMIGTWVAVVRLPAQRAQSRLFLSTVLGRPAGWVDVWRHFFTYLDFLLLRLRAASGAAVPCRLAPENAGDFEALIQSGEPALFGTFHFGHSDLLGFLLASRGRRVAMVRLRVGNSADTAMLEAQFGKTVSFIWVNEPENLLFAMKAAIERGDSLAMQCDRLFSSRTESFDFFGARRIFPFAIYHLAILFHRPVIFCLGFPEGRTGTRVVASPVFRPDPRLSREQNLAGARAHFQRELTQLEGFARQYPHLWFNFLPLNPVAPVDRAAIPATPPASTGPMVVRPAPAP